MRRRLLLRADSSAQIGAGHVARMVALAEEAAARGWRVAFAGEIANAEFLATRFDELGVPRLPPETTADGFDAMVVDHYGIGELRAAVNAAGAALVSFEDGPFGRRAADVVVDCGFAAAARPADGSPLVLTGACYTPLRQVVMEARRKRQARDGVPEPPRVLVVLGGGGVWQDTVSDLLTALRDTGSPCTVEALVRGTPALPAAAAGQRFLVSPPGPGLHDRLVETDLVVSAAGVTLFELCCVGVPSALVRLVDNQDAGYRAALAQGFAVGLGSPGALENAAETLRGLLAEREALEGMAVAASAAVDGQGAARVLDEIDGVLR
ncbi:spore coat protein [Saccharomonospora sp. NPDC046836]|uniref:spore coat protein n=1 Tax=Saccharomonospora sp. NPDC046836 TaxID=3156921 RepID=UPI0033D03FA4